uniref:Uncharacterized protein n=1 Tax=Cacopsylla melanoneura TaxID=428564 RepID=A0A8D8XDU4_9HEMI
MPLFDFYGPNPTSDQSSSEHNEEALKNPLLDYHLDASSSDSGFGSTSRNCVNDIEEMKGPNEIQPDLIGNGSPYTPYKANKKLKLLTDGVSSCNQSELLYAKNTKNNIEENLQKCQIKVKTTDDDDKCSQIGCNKNPRKPNVEKSSLAQQLLQEMERTLPKAKPDQVYQKGRNDQSNCSMKDKLTKNEDVYPCDADSNDSNEKIALYNDTLHGFLEKSFNTPRGVTRTISRRISNGDGKKSGQEYSEDGTPRAEQLTECVKGASRSAKKESATKGKGKKKTPMENSHDDSLAERKSYGKSKRKLTMAREKMLESDDDSGKLNREFM